MSGLSALRPDLPRLAGLHAFTILGQAWREPIDLPPPPAVVLPTPAILRPSEGVIDETRLLALHLHQGREHLTDWDRIFVRELLKWRCPPSALEADEIAVLAERQYWHQRDGAAPC